MLTKQDLEQRLIDYHKSQQELQASHDVMVNHFKEQVAQNQARFAQISGAIQALTELLKLYEPTTDNGSTGSTEPGTSVDRIFNPGDSPRDYLGDTMVYRVVDTPNPTAGETGAGDSPPDPGDNLGTPEFHGR